jgi:hypothetical protein
MKLNRVGGVLFAAVCNVAHSSDPEHIKWKLATLDHDRLRGVMSSPRVVAEISRIKLGLLQVEHEGE